MAQHYTVALWQGSVRYCRRGKFDSQQSKFGRAAAAHNVLSPWELINVSEPCWPISMATKLQPLLSATVVLYKFLQDTSTKWHVTKYRQLTSFLNLKTSRVS